MSLKPWRYLLLVGFFLSTATTVWADSRYVISGISGLPLDNVTAFLPAIPLSNDVNNAQYQRRVYQRVSEALQAVGYYSPSISVTAVEEDADWTVVVAITLGIPTVISEFDWSLTGAGANDQALLKAFSDSPVKSGTKLNHDQYTTLKSDLQSTALSLGYLDSRFDTAQVLVNLDNDRAVVTLHFVTGERYYFGNIMFTETPFDSELVNRISDISTGSLFSSTQINQLYQDMVNSRYFQSVSIQPDLEARDMSQIPVTVELNARARNALSMGVGASTNEGARLKVGWEKPWINGVGHRVQSAMEYSNVIKKVTAGYQIPLEEPLNEFIALQVGWQRETFEDIVIDKQSLAVERQNIVGGKWSQTIFMRWDKERSDVNGDFQYSNLYVPGITWSRVGGQSKMGGQSTMARQWGVNQTYSLELSSGLWGSDANLARFRAQLSGTISPKPKHYIYLRSAFGAIIDDDAGEIPASMRFFAGGDQSIRGFEYNSIGTLDNLGNLIGGQYLVVGGAEYAYAYLPNWRAALFIDVGDAFDTESSVKIGVGPGIHWLTPIGTLRFEIGYGISEPTPPTRLHISFGMQL